MKKLIALILTLALVLTFGVTVGAATEQASITVTRANYSDDYDYGFEAEYTVTCVADALDGDAWIGIYAKDLVEKVLADEDVFSGHSFGSWCSVTLEGSHGTALEAGEYKVNHTEGEWGDFVINEGASNPDIWGGPLDPDAEYQAVLFKCDSEGYEIVAVSDAFKFTAPVSEETKAPETQAPETKPAEDPAKTGDALIAAVAVVIAAVVGVVLVKKH